MAAGQCFRQASRFEPPRETLSRDPAAGSAFEGLDPAPAPPPPVRLLPDCRRARVPGTLLLVAQASAFLQQNVVANRNGIYLRTYTDIRALADQCRCLSV